MAQMKATTLIVFRWLVCGVPASQQIYHLSKGDGGDTNIGKDCHGEHFEHNRVSKQIFVTNRITPQCQNVKYVSILLKTSMPARPALDDIY